MQLYDRKDMLLLSTDIDGKVGTARTMVLARKKAKVHANMYNEAVYIMRDNGETGYEELEAIKPTREVK